MARKTGSVGALTATKGMTWMDTKNLVRPMLESGVSVLVRGHPGIGKSAMAQALAAEMGLPLVDIRLAQRDPADVAGVYFPDDGREMLRLLPPDWVRDASSKPVMVFLDEINAAVTKLHQAAAYQIVLEKRVGPFKFHEGTVVLAAGNLEEDNAIVTPLSSALSNRFAHFRLRPDAKSWVEWGAGNGMDGRILGFIAAKGDDLLYQNNGGDAFPSPRTWEMASRVLARADAGQVRRVVEACVGVAAAVDFVAWLDLYGKIDPEAIIRKGEMVDFTRRGGLDPSFRYAAIFAVATWVLGREAGLKPPELENLVRFLGSKGLDPEFQLLCLRKIRANEVIFTGLRGLASFRAMAGELVGVRVETYG
jgi:hypothetical protein